MSASKDPSRNVRPPTVVSPSTLPFHDLSPDDFERICQDIASHTDYSDVHRYGSSGQKQDGIDFHGIDNAGQRVAWQCKRVKSFSSAELKRAVQTFAEGPRAENYATFVVCIACEGSDRSLQDELADLEDQHCFALKLWGSPSLTASLRALPDVVHQYFGEDWTKRIFAPLLPALQRLDAKALLYGPVEAHGLTLKVEEADRLADSSPAEAVQLYGEIEHKLREHSPRHADRFHEKRAFALIGAAGPEVAHDEFMRLAVRDLFGRAEPELSPEVARGLGKLRDQVDPTRRARGEALFHFRWSHEDPERLSDLANCFDELPLDDEYAAHIAILMVESAVAEQDHRLVNDRRQRIQQLADHANGDLALRLRVALADADQAESWLRLIADAQTHRFGPREATFICMRAARWSAWNGNSEQAESLYRQAMSFGADAGLDLDVKNALRSLLSLYRTPERFNDFSEAHQLMLTLDGKASFISQGAQTARYSYQSLATGELPEAHLLTRYRILEGVRSGCLSEEIEAHGVLARVYLESSEPMEALEHAVHGGDQELAKKAASQIDAWPEFLGAMVGAAAAWVRLTALHALEHLGDLAPPQVEKSLAHDLIGDLLADPGDPTMERALYEALSAVVLEATDEDIRSLMPAMRQAVNREPGGYRWTDPGVVTTAARLYRFRPGWREQAAEILAERLNGLRISDWWLAINECGSKSEALIVALERTAARTGVNLDEALARLGHLSDSTRTYWSKRARYVAEHPVGPMSSQRVGDDFEVPRQFLEEQPPEEIGRYVGKLVAIASSSHVITVNRAGALLVGGNVVGMLPSDQRSTLFEAVRPLVEPDVGLFEQRGNKAVSDHPLSRVRIRRAGATDLHHAAGWFLGRSAANAEQRAIVILLAKDWLFSDVQKLQQQAALLLSLPNLAGHGVRAVQLARHPNSMVRWMAPFMPDFAEVPDTQLARELATDPNRNVRLSVIDVLPLIDPEARLELLAILTEDRSAIVRHTAANSVAGD